MSKSTISTFELFAMFPDAETARLAASAIAETQTQDSYDNFQAALQEIRGVLK